MKAWDLLQTRGPEVAKRYAAATGQKAVDYIEKSPPFRDRGAALIELEAIRNAADVWPWMTPGNPGTRGRRAFEAICLRAWELGGPELALALRDWALRAGLEFSELRRARASLLASPWLRRAPGSSSMGATRYRLARPHSLTSWCEVTVWGRGETVSLLVSHDAFRPLALGSAAWVLLHAVEAGASDAETIRRALGWWGVSRAAPSLEQVLSRLLMEGLLVEDDGELRVASVLEQRLGAIAARCSTAGALEVDRMRYEEDRARFHVKGKMEVGRERALG